MLYTARRNTKNIAPMTAKENQSPPQGPRRGNCFESGARTDDGRGCQEEEELPKQKFARDAVSISINAWTGAVDADGASGMRRDSPARGRGPAGCFELMQTIARKALDVIQATYGVNTIAYERHSIRRRYYQAEHQYTIAALAGQPIPDDPPTTHDTLLAPAGCVSSYPTARPRSWHVLAQCLSIWH